MASFSNLKANLGIDISNFTSGLRTASSQAKNFGNKLNSNISSFAETFNKASKRTLSAAANMSGKTVKEMFELNRATTAWGLNVKSVSRVVSGIIISQAFYGIVQDIKQASKAVMEFSSELEYAKLRTLICLVTLLWQKNL